MRVHDLNNEKNSGRAEHGAREFEREADASQLSRLGLILSGYETVADSANGQIRTLRQVVGSGIYEVDSEAVSKRIVDAAWVLG